jgi:hypothetical protein
MKGKNMSNQESKGKKELSEQELQKAAGGAFDPGTGGGAVPTTDTGADADPGPNAMGVDPDTYHAIFPESARKPQE